jgi:hypothetical protein
MATKQFYIINIVKEEFILPASSTVHDLACSLLQLLLYWNRMHKNEPGCSWIEIKDIAQVFIVDDQNHPEREKICFMLEDCVCAPFLSLTVRDR